MGNGFGLRASGFGPDDGVHGTPREGVARGGGPPRTTEPGSGAEPQHERSRRSPRLNEDIADVLERVAELLRVQDANAFRVRAYRQASQRVRQLRESVAELALDRPPGELEALPDIGKSIAAAIREYVSTGRLGLLERLEGQVSPEDLFATVPGVGETLAARIHAELGVETLEELELAAHDGRLEGVSGFGPRRAEAMREILGGLLSRSSRRRARLLEAHHHEDARPPVETLLEVDAIYRERAARGELRTITPRRFNPERRAWLPILHVERDGWDCTVLFSNTARAHALGTTHDWVIVYYERDGDEGQATVVTEHRGAMAGRRVVRGRESECRT